MCCFFSSALDLGAFAKSSAVDQEPDSCCTLAPFAVFFFQSDIPMEVRSNLKTWVDIDAKLTLPTLVSINFKSSHTISAIFFKENDVLVTSWQAILGRKKTANVQTRPEDVRF